MKLPQLLADLRGGHRLTEEEALCLISARGPDAWKIAAAADERRFGQVGDTVTYVSNQNVHVTNICKNLCGFCGFGRNAGDPDAYCDTREQIQAKVRGGVRRGATECCLLSGVHPGFSLDDYLGQIAAVREVAPQMHVHLGSPEEVAFMAVRSGLSSIEVLGRLREAGLGSLQGTAAEILVDDVRRAICPGKIDTATWCRIIREAHGLGIPSTATIMYGSVESAADRVRHLAILRQIQDETHGFTEFVPLSFIHMNTPIYRAGQARAGATGCEDILLVAVSRLFLDNFDHIQVSWLKYGAKLAQLGLMAGGNDLGGTMYTDEVSRDAGTDEAVYLSPVEMKRLCDDIGRPLRERTTLYDIR